MLLLLLVVKLLPFKHWLSAFSVKLKLACGFTITVLLTVSLQPLFVTVFNVIV